MLPAHLAENIQEQVLYYLQSTFTFREEEVRGAFTKFINDPENGLFKGPWVQLRRPFRTAEEGYEPPLELEVPFHPFVHQAKSWERLSGRDQEPLSTIVTTGTGSGKTECFLYPVLNHCLQMRSRGQKGIKAIVLYPMNALAADQETRFAKTIWKDPELKKAGIRVGTFTGRYDSSDPSASQDSGTRIMGEDHGISHHETLLENPPDILLTNYKMLDFLLMRPRDQRLWIHNQPGVLKYLVLDELHTYDGAQGSDVACLIRRLKERMEVPKGGICVVGTSATLDNSERSNARRQSRPPSVVPGGSTAKEKLARFASTLFEEEIPLSAIIEEDRFDVHEIVHDALEDLSFPSPSDCAPQDDEDALAYTRRQAVLWGGPAFIDVPDATEEQEDRALVEWRLQLGDWIKGARFFEQLLRVFADAEKEGKDPLDWAELTDRLAQVELGFSTIQNGDDRRQLLTSFLALVSHAMELRSGNAFPLVPTQVQLWVRELRRIGRAAQDKPMFTWLDEPVPGVQQLPAFQCSECGESGWVALHDPSKDAQIGQKGVSGIQLVGDPTRIYRGWFGQNGKKDQYIVILSPYDEKEEKHEQLEIEATGFYLFGDSLVLRSGKGPCPISDSHNSFRVKVNREQRPEKDDGGKVVGAQCCPRCESADGLFFIGSQSATLSSVAIDEMFGSTLNSDPKLLAFTDSVQDASHRAGFFSARTYHFTLRTALQHIIDDAGKAGVPLTQVGPRLIEYWSEDKPGRLKSVKETIAALIPTDLQQYEPFLKYRDDESAEQPPEKFFKEIIERLNWEATSEFGLMKTHGRTMEMAGSACVGWDNSVIDKTVEGLRDQMPGISPVLEKIDDRALKLWVLGLLHRYRERGSMGHPYMSDFSRRPFWGKTAKRKVVPGRETFPPAGRFKPKLLVTAREKRHEHILAASRGGRLPWALTWSLRALERSNLDETTLIDLLHEFLKVGAKTELLTKTHSDGKKDYYAINEKAAVLYSGGVPLKCKESGNLIVRPAVEAELWVNAPSLDYYASESRYKANGTKFSARQLYYQDRYRKGALRRVMAFEHTGLLDTEEREALEESFSDTRHADDPNVLTCTSTLEMGIDIGDLSSTMLCSVPPTTASYLQRIGRAGRATGTALIVSVINQRPHDLFFFARPAEMLRGKVEPPGCWLDAAAVLARQYLGYCFDCANKAGVLSEIPRSGGQLVDDLNIDSGHIPRMLEWMKANESELSPVFLSRFEEHIDEDTRARLLESTNVELLDNRIRQVANDFDNSRREIANAQKRLKGQLAALGADEQEARNEIGREIGILSGRARQLGSTGTLELLTDAGLLPNYAFPERGVRFYGSVYNGYSSEQQEPKPIELTRPAGQAIKELAPANWFYTHKRQFKIQQIAIGNDGFPLLSRWAICGKCGHMRPAAELSKNNANPACPQCGHDGDCLSQQDTGQHRNFLEFSQSQAISYMDRNESLSGDRSDERNRAYYQTIRSFDQTIEKPTGAVGDDGLPFGIEYRSAMIMRDVNVGYSTDRAEVSFGPSQKAPELGFVICKSCGMVVPPDTQLDKVGHRRSCKARKKADEFRQKGKTGNPYQWENVYIYRELKSEAVRLLLPLSDDDDLDTLVACLHLGLRLRFEGNPAHLIITPQVLPDAATGLEKRYMVMMDAVPGGTGYLKTLFQEKDTQGLAGEGIINVLRLAHAALKNCACRKLKEGFSDRDTDGCYRCIRTYHMQYQASSISAQRGINLLEELIEAGEKRESKETLTHIKADAIYGSVLEKRFVKALRGFVEEERDGKWESTIIKGARGFRFSLGSDDRIWELSLQPTLGIKDDVYIQSNPDFMLTCDDESIKPSVIFTDGFEYHCYPKNRLADDMSKRRAILASGRFWVWSLTWDDLESAHLPKTSVCPPPVAKLVANYASTKRRSGLEFPLGDGTVGNGFVQLKSFLEAPKDESWNILSNLVAFVPLHELVSKRRIEEPVLMSAIDAWKSGGSAQLEKAASGDDWVITDRVGQTLDTISCCRVENVLENKQRETLILARLDDRNETVQELGYKNRWNQFLASMNLFQFSENFRFWTTSEIEAGSAPEVPLQPSQTLSPQWADAFEKVTSSAKPLVKELAQRQAPHALADHYDDKLPDEAFAELAWPNAPHPVVVLCGEQQHFAKEWNKAGFKVLSLEEIRKNGIDELVAMLG